MHIHVNPDELDALFNYDNLRKALRPYLISDLANQIGVNYFFLQRFLAGSHPRPNAEMLKKIITYVNDFYLLEV